MKMFIYNLLLYLITFKTNIQFPICTDDSLRVLYDDIENNVVLSCDKCNWAQFINGDAWNKNYFVTYPENIILRKFGFIK